ncbi:ADP-ribosylglycohydrolase [Baekduia alba]|uniref:ADP-ribosylglycohydrolase family protein n=1 Tax=Baekduia alba TaxID=2997333 RepID=UPI00234077E1|nr:ADP-ribosylglycohydrolase family protein [Baekduia alba]WCB93419.1 ADP-ribosylglycohydrolase [Baekduia alba]
MISETARAIALEDRAVGCLAGSAVGDALGGPTEGWSPEDIRARYGGWVEGFVPPFYPDWREARPIAPYRKGDGRVTDDTLMTHALVRVYRSKRDHLDAYDIASELVPLMIGEKQWIPELDREALPLERVFLAEKWLVLRLHYGHVDPREAGVGNVVNCGAAMYMAPVGVANAANPRAAYAEAIDLAGPHQSSFGREAAGVLAAGVAAAMAPGATADSVIGACLDVAHDGTAAAIDAVVEAAGRCDSWREALPVLRDAVRPYDTVADTYREPGLGARRPSRLHAIEELPVALGLVRIAGGRYEDAVLAGVNYGRDSDSIASMAGAICGALHGRDAVPEAWRTGVAYASRLDIEEPGRGMAAVAAEIFARDVERRTAVDATFRALLEDDACA